MSIFKRASCASLLVAVGMLTSHVAMAGAVITFGETSLGVNDTGELNFLGDGPNGSMVYGVFRAGLGDAISPGCPCEGWGVSVLSGGQTYATWANQSSGSGGFGSGNTFGSTLNTATSVVNMADLAVSVRQAYGPSLAADVFQNQVTITNNTGAAIDNLIYRRAMDWDVPPTEFNEYVTHQGVTANLVANGGNVLFASDNGFATSNPTVDASFISEATVNTDFIRDGVNDHGSVFDFSFGPLAAGSSRIFNIYYGSAANEAAAVSKLTMLGADVYSLGQRSLSTGGGGGGEVTAMAALVEDNPGNYPTFLFGFGGVGGVETGSTEEVPVLPFVPAPGQFTFDAPVARRWYDPPMADGFDIALVGGDFISVTAPTGYSDLVLLDEDGNVLDADFDAGDTYTFASGFDKFKIRGILLDTASPSFSSAFPLLLDFTPGVTSMTWTASLAPAVPEPESYALVLSGLMVVAGLAARRKRA